MFNQRWNREFASTNRQATGINYCLSRSIENATATEDDRASELSVISKTLILRSIYRLTTFEMVKSTLESLLATVSRTENLLQTTPNEDDLVIRNPLRVKTKGRPKTGNKRYISQAEKSQSKRKSRK